MKTIRVIRRLPSAAHAVMFASLAVSLCIFEGCGKKGQPTGAVQGKITFDAKPVTEGNVIFENAERGWLRVAPLGSQGEYHMPDLPAAEYKVSIRPPEPRLPDESSSARGVVIPVAGAKPDPANIPARFRTSQSTPLQAIIAEGPNTFDFDLAKP